MKKLLRLILLIIWTLIIWRLTTTPQLVMTDNSLIQALLMIGGHFFFFGIEALLIFSLNLAFSTALLLATLYGAIIELYQRKVPGRSADPVDLALDLLGALTFLFIYKKLQSELWKRSKKSS